MEYSIVHVFRKGCVKYKSNPINSYSDITILKIFNQNVTDGRKSEPLGSPSLTWVEENLVCTIQCFQRIIKIIKKYMFDKIVYIPCEFGESSMKLL